MAEFYIKKGDTAPAIQDSLVDGNGKALPSGSLTGATIRFVMQSIATGQNVVSDTTHTSVVQDDGVATIVKYQWQAADTATAGLFLIEWEITFSSGLIETFPNSREKQIQVVADLF